LAHRLRRPSEFFLGQDLFWWLHNGALKKTEKRREAEIIQGA
jgi:hypothetical protein